MSATNTSRSNSNAGHFALCIEGLPANYTWQDVKDLARNRAEHGIRADVAYRTGMNGEQIPVHVAKVTRRNEANSLYDWLVTNLIEQRSLRVHFFEGSTCIKSNCELGNHCSVCRSKQHSDPPTPYVLGPAPVPQAWMYQTSAATPSPMLPPHPSQQVVAGAYSTQPNAHYGPPPLPQVAEDAARLQHAASLIRAQAAAGGALNATQEEFLRRMATMRIDSAPAQNRAMPAVHAAAASGAPINTLHGYARTEFRGVFVSGLDFKTKSQDVEDLFSKAGTVKKCQLHTDSRGNGKGTATIEFATSAEATQAIKTLHNFPWRGRTLRVRSDREAFVIRAPTNIPSSSSSRRRASDDEDNQEPTIVDGSNSRQNRRDSKVALFCVLHP